MALIKFLALKCGTYLTVALIQRRHLFEFKGIFSTCMKILHNKHKHVLSLIISTFPDPFNSFFNGVFT